MKPRLLSALLLLVSLLAGCAKEPTGFKIEGGNHSLTVERNQPYFWSEGWELNLIVTRFPECQRRYPLKKSGEKVRVDLYSPESGVFILNQGKRWYVAETKECRMQQYEEAPAEPGQFLGAFRVKNGVFGFVPTGEDKNSKAAKE